MATVSKKEIVKTVSERHGLTTTQTAQIVQVFMDQIIDELARGNRIEFREFGIFELKRRRARRARNPKTGAPVQVPEKTIVSFKPGKVMKARVVDTIPDERTERKVKPTTPKPVGTTPSMPVNTPLAAFNPPTTPKPAPAPPPPPPPVKEPEPEPTPPPPPAPPPPPSPSSFY